MAMWRFSCLISFFTLPFIILLISPGYAQNKEFSNQQIEREARAFQTQLEKNWEVTHKKQWKDQTKSYEDWLASAKRAKNINDTKIAQEALWAALILNPKDGESWLEFAKGYVALQLPKNKRNERIAFARTAASAAYIAYTLQQDKAFQADALATLAQALTQRSYWRPALEAYKASLALAENKDVRAAYNELNAQYGFRVTNYNVDAETENPRICIRFSETLAKGKSELANFISVNGKDPAAVTRENQQLCLEGLVHGKRYDVKVRAGLLSKIGETLTKTSNLKIYVRDRSPAVRTSGQNYVLPKTGQNGIPFVSVNTDKLKVEVHRIGDRALSQTMMQGYLNRQFNGYSINRLKQDVSKQIWSGEMDVKSVLNKEVTTAFPVNEIIKDIEPGLYVLYASPVSSKKIEQFTPRAGQWFIVSDLGLATLSGPEGLHIFIRSLATAEPLKAVKVKLLARNNEILGTGQTNDKGHIRFDKGIISGEGAQSPYLVVAEREQGDYAFLDVTKSAFDLTDRGVGGRQAPGPLDAFVFTERGVYRSGEQVYLTALLRDDNGIAVPKLPLTLVITRPDGVEHERLVWQDEGHGGRSHILSLQNNAMSGTWQARVYSDPKASPVGRVSFLVEDYSPQRLELTLSPTNNSLVVGEKADIVVSGKYLYGAPASGLQLDGDVLIRKSATGIKGFNGYNFGQHDEKFLPLNTPLSTLPRTSTQGQAQIPVTLPELQPVNLPLEAEVTLRMTEPGGKSISEQVRLPINPLKPLLGIKPLFQSGQLAQGETAQFELISLDTNAQQTAIKGLKWELLKVEQRYQWYNRNGSWNYETISYTTKVGNGSIDTKSDAPVSLNAPVKWGRYRLEVSSDDVNGPVASYGFYAGWYGSTNADTPDILDIALDKPSYTVGDKVSVSLDAKTKGKALIAVVDQDIRETRLIDVGPNTAKVDFEVQKEWGPGTYITAFFYRPMDEKAKRMPSRSIGITWLNQDKTDNKLKLSINVPERTRPNNKLSVPVKVEGLKTGAETYLTLAAVDVGILNLTKYKAPEPESWYYGKRRLAMNIRDLYGKLIDGMQAVRGKIRSGGDAVAGLQSEPPKNIEPVALFSGIVTVNDKGIAEILLDLPAFDGSLRLMAVAWNGTQVGSAHKDIIVRDPVVVIGTAPRFLTAGDSSSLHLSLDNVEGPEGEFSLKLESTGPLTVEKSAIDQTVQLALKERKDISVPLSAHTQSGTVTITARLSGPQDFALERTFAFQVHPAAPNVTRRFVFDIKPDGGKVSIGKDILTDLIPESAKVSVNVTQGTALDVPGLLLALDRYPYGCAEQTTSQALPLLYLSSVAERTGVAGINGAKDRINQAIQRLASMQVSNGAFGLWGPQSEDLWLTAYVSDFLTRAQAQGYKVADKTFELALDRLQNSVNYAPDFKNGGEGLAYALYVLARNGRAGIGDLRYYVDTKLSDFSTPLAQAQLGAALAMYGDKTRAEQAYAAVFTRLNPSSTGSQNDRRDYGSSLRDGAATLTLVAETKTSQQAISSLTQVLESARQTKSFTSTQENAWLLLAAHALQGSSKDLKLLVNDKAHSGYLQRILTSSQLSKTDFTVTNQTGQALKAAVTVTGDGQKPEPALSKGFRIERKIYTLDGQLTSLVKVKQNERYVVLLSVDEEEAKQGRLVLVDRLPAGFEIENPRLVSSSSTKRLAWLKTKGYPEHTEFKDDKFFAAFHVIPGSKKLPKSLSVAYIIRAVSPGTYMHPAAVIEDMYRPDRFARTDAGKSQIVK